MAHIHDGKGEHDLTVSAFIVRTDLPDPKLLLHMHKKLHVLLQPGGHVELNEDPWMAIQHELQEETGYSFDELQLLQPQGRLTGISQAKLHPIPVVVNTHNFDHEGHHKHTDMSYAFVAKGEASLQPGEGESSDIRWLSLTELDALSESEIYENVREIGRYVLSTVLSSWEQVEPTDYS